MDINEFIYICNFLGIISFAISGVFKGIKHNHDIVGVTFLAIVTSVGGGIIRDVLLNRTPLVLKYPHDIYLAFYTALIVYIPYLLFKDKIIKFENLVAKIRITVLIFDAIGLSIFIYIGASISLLFNLNTIGIIILSTITAVGGGVVRDILANETPFILKEDIYALLCIIGSYLYKLFIVDFKINQITTVFILFTFILVIRLIVIFKKLNLPK